VSAPANFNGLWARAIAQELARGGVRNVVIAPGSRSAPLALALAAEPSLRASVVLDERSAAFVALGAAKATGRPAAVLATSGSAGAHFFPAALEAAASRAPLLLLTADRPLELHGFGAPQTMDQQRLFGHHARHFADLGAPEPTDAAVKHVRATVSRAVQLAVAPQAGPVHLNAPFREPLAPVAQPLPPGLSQLALEGRVDRPFLEVSAGAGTTNPAALDALIAELRCRPRGVIICGPRAADGELAAAVTALSEATGYAVLAEAASNLRGRVPGAITTYDTLLRHEALATALRPDAVVRLGGGLTSKVLQSWLDASGAFTLLLSEGGALFDPAHAAAVVVDGDGSITVHHLAERLAGRAPGPLARSFAAAEAAARGALEATFAAAGDASITEPRLAREVAAALPDGAQLVVSSSMPIRDLDAFAPGLRARALANRGLNGIDGIVSTAAGAALGAGRATAVYLGDLALLHDLGGLVAARRLGVPLAVVVPNNDGGGIFHFLPVAEHAAAGDFERLFGTPHGVDLAAAAALAGATLHRPRSASELRATLRESMGSGLHLIEVRTDRAANVAAHRALQQRVVAALGEGPWA
jgi:2-succinyl-5-enolpyruvyl-6-hydroxy-3-cyclohexene-1-carboxylate synthase